MFWILAAVLSAIFAGLTSILAKCGIKKTDSDLATALRTIVVLAFSWIMVFVVGSQATIVNIQTKSLLFLILSGLATGASWICYFKALSMGDINKVVNAMPQPVQAPPPKSLNDIGGLSAVKDFVADLVFSDSTMVGDAMVNKAGEAMRRMLSDKKNIVAFT